MRDEDVAETVKLFKERSAFWTSQGFTGPALYEALASDAALPENLHPKVIAAIENVKDHSSRCVACGAWHAQQTTAVIPRCQ